MCQRRVKSVLLTSLIQFQMRREILLEIHVYIKISEIYKCTVAAYNDAITDQENSLVISKKKTTTTVG